jgi:hypothetical protein
MCLWAGSPLAFRAHSSSRNGIVDDRFGNGSMTKVHDGVTTAGTPDQLVYAIATNLPAA